jgi:hypothetical protein
MDSQSLDDHQKEFLNNLFPLDDPSQHHSNDIQQQQQQQQPIFHYNNQQTSPNLNTNVANQLELLGNLMAMQGIESPTTVPQCTPHLLLEQQFKLTQLQQLQQLQNQIFQQQVSTIPYQSSEPPRSHTLLRPISHPLPRKSYKVIDCILALDRINQRPNQPCSSRSRCRYS